MATNEECYRKLTRLIDRAEAGERAAMEELRGRFFQALRAKVEQEPWMQPEYDAAICATDATLIEVAREMAETFWRLGDGPA